MGEFRPSRPGERRGGRQKGTPNKFTGNLREMILRAAELAGNDIAKEAGQTPEGMVSYLRWAARNEGPAFIGLVGKILPSVIQGPDEKPIIPTTINIVAAKKK